MSVLTERLRKPVQMARSVHARPLTPTYTIAKDLLLPFRLIAYIVAFTCVFSAIAVTMILVALTARKSDQPI